MIIFPPIPIKAKYFVLIYGGLELILAIMQPGSSIAHAAHVGGMIFGYILIKYWQKTTTTLY
jgi:membrane associated rhomboid family serine protease